MKNLFFAFATLFCLGSAQAQTTSEITKSGTITELSADLSTGKLIDNSTGLEGAFFNPSSIAINIGDNVTFLEIKGRSIPENSIDFMVDELKGRSIPENSIDMVSGGGKVIRVVKEVKF